jgi:hypothetical protein
VDRSLHHHEARCPVYGRGHRPQRSLRQHLTWLEGDKPKRQLQRVEINVDLDFGKFYKMFVELMRAPTPPPATH